MSSVAEPVKTVVERGGSVLEIVDGRLVRRRGGEVSELRCSSAESPGEIREIAADPGGLTFVAAEAGLYVLSADVDHLDRIELGDGAPQGSPYSVFVDERRRVWLGTSDVVGVLDPSFFYGRVLEGAFEPGRGPFRIEPTEGGRFEISSSDGTTVYVPDGPEKPNITDVRLDEHSFQRADGPLRLSYGDSPLLGATGQAAGEVSFRYRVDMHHVWQALEEGSRLRPLSPGSHQLDVVAVDRDLNFSEPLRVPLEVDYPFYYDHVFVLQVAGGMVVLIVGLFMVRAARGGGGSKRHVRGLVSAALLLVILVQVLAGLIPHGRGWPFMGFDMYTDRYGEGDAVYDSVLVGIKKNYHFVLDPQQVGIAIDSRWQVLRPLIDRGDEAAREYMAAFRERHPDSPLTGLQVQARRLRLTPEGPVPVAPLVLFSYEEAWDG